MNQITNKAISGFRTGLNCSQAVLAAFTDKFMIDNNLALSISCGFGGGMGRLQETCGAATGSFMVLGVYNCSRYTNNSDRKEKTYSMIQDFSKRFLTIHGSLNCKKLLNCDLKTEEGQLYWKNNNLGEVVCEKCITDSIMILDELMQVQS